MERLIVPVYLNQKFVFDLLAMLQGGISTVTAVTNTSSDKNAEKEKLSVGFGLSEAFSTLLKIDLSGAKERSQASESGKVFSEERVHTPASLFYQLRNLLIEKSYLKILSDSEQPEAGDFIEFEGYLKRNPIVEVIDSLAEMMNIAENFEEKPANTNKKLAANQNPSDFQKLRKQMLQFSDTLKAGSTIDLTSKSILTGHSAVITVEASYLNDPMMSDLVDGKFKVMGKVIRNVTSNGDSINLLRKTALSKMPESVLQGALSHLSNLGTTQGFNIPELVFEIKGPAMQILPIAIYA